MTKFIITSIALLVLSLYASASTTPMDIPFHLSSETKGKRQIRTANELALCYKDFKDSLYALSEASDKMDSIFPVNFLDNKEVDKVNIPHSKVNDAYNFYLQAKKGLEQKGNINSLSITLCQLGVLCSQMDKEEEACNYFQKSADLCMQTGNQYLESKARRYAWDILRRTNPLEALVQLERYSELTDIIFNAQVEEKQSEFKVKFETAEKVYKSEIQEKQVMINKMWQILLSVLGIASVLGITLTWRLVILRGKAKAMLKRTNQLKERLLSMTKKNYTAPIIKMEANLGKSKTDESSHVNLTRREIQVMALCCNGMFSKEIAEELGISLRTVETHKTNIFRKLGINTTVDLIQYAHHAGIAV